jgi:polyhydroxyalkanoate synthesis regulator phasin
VPRIVQTMIEEGNIRLERAKQLVQELQLGTGKEQL